MLNRLFNVITLFFKNFKSADPEQNWHNPDITESYADKIKKDLPFENEKIYFAWPVKVLRITSPYGWRTLQGRRVWHTGVDYSGRDNKIAQAVFDGTVTKVLKPDYEYPVKFVWNVRLNKFVDVQGIPTGRAWTPYLILQSRYDTTVRAIYRHVESLFPVGAMADIGQDICNIGNWGYSQGPHLHIEIEKFDGSKWNRVDPVEFLNKKINKGRQ